MSNKKKKDKQPLDSGEIGLVEMRSTSTPLENNDSLGISGTNKPDVTTGIQSHSDEASTSTKTKSFLLDCAKEGEIFVNEGRLRICKASRVLRDHSESSFEPQLVSIGPIHSEDPKLKEFEWLKSLFLYGLLDRCKEDMDVLLDVFLQEVNSLIPHFRESYDGVKKKYSDSELAMMMVMDGCFILEFCFKHEDKGNEFLKNKMQANRIAMDLMLLENQVPFIVLKDLFKCMVKRMKEKVGVTLNQALNKYLAPYVMLFCSLFPEKIFSVEAGPDHDHVLAYLHTRCQLIAKSNIISDAPNAAEASDRLPDEEQAPKSNIISDAADAAEASDRLPDEEQTPKSNIISDAADAAEASDRLPDEEQAPKSNIISIPADAEPSKPVNEERIPFYSIVELDRSGMNFRPHPEDDWSMTIKYRPSLFPCLPWFWGKPTLLMPSLVINGSTELILRNLIAYEQLYPVDRSCFTPFAVAMDMLINTQEDIAKLVESEVLENRLGSNQEAADMFNKICKNMITHSCYPQEFKQMDKHYKSFWPKNIARLRRVYFSNPWSIIALVAAIILFGLTVVQTIFAIKGK